jgi:hypothetical protein
MKNRFFFILKVTEDFGTDLHPDPLIKGTDPRIRIRIKIRTKMLRIRNTDLHDNKQRDQGTAIRRSVVSIRLL